MVHIYHIMGAYVCMYCIFTGLIVSFFHNKEAVESFGEINDLFLSSFFFFFLKIALSGLL